MPLFTNYAGFMSAYIAKQECTLMHARISFIQYFILLAIFCVLAACSDSDTTEALPIPVTEAALFPFIQDHTLYNFDPKTGEKEKLAESNKLMMIPLDTDQSSIEQDEDDTNYLEHTSLPEYIVYVQDQTLRVYDLYTRYDHLLIDFSASNDQEDNVFICQLKNIRTADIESLDGKKTLLKDERGVYVKTSTNENCNEDEDTPNFQYLEVEIADSYTKEFEIRRTRLLPHEHFHTHKHEHDYDHDNDNAGDHDHDSDHEPDPNYPEEAPHNHDYNHDDLHTHQHGIDVIDDRKNHEHKHEHTHDFIYPILEEHKFSDTSPESVEAVHNNLKYQQIETETHPVLIGRILTVDLTLITDPTLMYATIIVDVNNSRFGYLGFNYSTTDPAYKFFEIIGDDLDKQILWEISSDEFLIQPENGKGVINRSFSDSIMIEFNWKMVKWNEENLFNQSKNDERELSINQPFFQREQEDNYTSSYFTTNNEDIMAIRKKIIVSGEEKHAIYTVSKEGVESHVRTFDFDILEDNVEENLEDFQFTLFNDTLLTKKDFAINEEYSSTSYTKINIGSGIENTLFPKIFTPTRETFFQDPAFAISIEEDKELQDNEDIQRQWTSNYFNSDLETPPGLDSDLQNTIWGRVSDRRVDSENNQFVPALLYSKPFPNRHGLSEPSVYFFDSNTANGQGKKIGAVPTDVRSASDIIIYNQLFGKITIEENSQDLNNTNTVHKTYYFEPDDSTAEMKLMYEEVVN